MPQLKPTDLTDLLGPYQGKWVALAKDKTKVLGSGRTIEEALRQAKTSGEKEPLIMRAPDSVSALIL